MTLLPHTLAALAVTIHHHRLHLEGSPADYAGVALAAIVSWAGLPGPGEAALVTAAAYGARHGLDLGQVIAVAWLAATIGGTAGWLVGLRVGAVVAARPGPLYRLRMRGLRAGERFFERWGTFAVYLTPTWVAGINSMRAAKFLPANATAAIAWVVLYGLVPYAVGPSVVEVVDDLGLAGTAVIVVLALAAAAVAIARRRRR